MKIIAVRGKNIASLDGTFEIDFTSEPLVSAGLYAITGPTGSGKSTLLDVISLALYEQTPRLVASSKSTRIQDTTDTFIGINSPSTLLRRGTAEGFAEVDFIALDGDSYRATWKIRRGRNKIDQKIQNTEVILYNISKDQIFGEKKMATQAEIVRLLGLTFEQFSRAVVLAQGEFAAFLKAEDGVRGSLLEKITGTEVYSKISQKIHDKNGEAKRNLELLKVQMKAHNLLSDQELTELNTEIQTLETTKSNLEDELESLTNHQKWFKDLSIQEHEIKCLEEERVLLQQKATEEELQYKTVRIIERLSDAIHQNHRFNELKTSFQEIQTHLTKSQESSMTIKNETESQKLQVQAFEKEFNEILISEISLQKELAQARLLDTDLKVSRSELTNQENQFAKYQNESIQKSDLIAHNKTEISRIQEEVHKLNEWFQLNESRQEVALNMDVILYHLKLATSMKMKNADLLQEQEKENKNFEEISRQLQSIQLELTQDKQFLIDLSLKREQQEKIIADFNYDNLSNQKKEAESKRLKLNEIHLLWTKIQIPLKEKKDNSKKISQEQITINQAVAELKELNEKFFISEGKLSQSKKQFTQLQSKISENVTELRNHLEANQPCPVCGSLLHPYHEKTLSFFQEQYELAKKELKETEDLYNKLSVSVAQKNADLNNSEKLLKSYLLKEEELNNIIHSLEDEWVKMPIKELLGSSFDRHSESQLVKVIDQTNSSINQYNNEIEKYQKERKTLESINSDYFIQSNKQTKNIQNLNEYNERIAVSKNSLTSIRSVINQNNQAITEELTQVNNFFNHDTWQLKWNEDSQMFIKKLEAFATSWQQKKSAKESHLVQLEKLEQYNQITQKDIDSLTTQKSNCEKELSITTKKIEALTKERYQFFEGVDVDIVASEFNRKKELKNNSIIKLRQENQKQLQELSLLEGQINQLKEQLEQNLREQQKAIDSRTEILQNYQQQYNETIRIDYLNEIGSVPADQIQSIRNDYALLQESIIKNDTALRMHLSTKDELLKHKLLDFDAYETEKELKQKHQLKEKINEDLIKSKSKIYQHESNVKKIANLTKELQEKEVLFKNWNRLNDELGSQGGGRFKLIAQSYTLDLLLFVANEQIKHIAPRYRLRRIPETLSLQVVDTEMCDQIRSVNSLSGGETFLVSLALALALSSISSKQMNIESLFIDEGFGSLDEESLGLAMDALDSLRLQGRKVGVITHVKEMTERIHTQIKVIKKHNGASSIEIV